MRAASIRFGYALAVTSCAVAAPSVSAQNLQAWALTPDLRIGQLDGENYALTFVSDLEIDDSGRVYVAQSREKTIRVYTGAGGFLRTVGRSGAGPGEFRGVDTLGFAAGGIFAMDKAARRVTKFTGDGRFLRQWSIPSYNYSEGLIGTTARAILVDGSFVVIPTYRPQPSGDPTRLPLLIFDSAGEFMRTAGELRIGDQSIRVQAGRLVSIMAQPVNTQTLWAKAQDLPGVLLVNRSIGGTAGSRSTFEVVKISATSGDTLFKRTYHLPAKPIPAEVIERERERRIDANAKGLPWPRTLVAELFREGWKFPPFQAPVDRVLGSDDGTIWLREGSFGLEQSQWWVLNATGEMIARATMPSGLHVLRVTKTHVWGTERGEFGESYVVRLAISRK